MGNGWGERRRGCEYSSESQWSRMDQCGPEKCGSSRSSGSSAEVTVESFTECGPEKD
jgi:hypothetical protein